MFCVFMSAVCRRQILSSARALPAKMRSRSASGISSACTAAIVFLVSSRPPRRIERRVAGEYQPPSAEEIVAATCRRCGAVERGVGIEHMEIVDRRPLQPARLGNRIAVHGAVENLAEAKLDAAGEIRDHSAQVMGDDFQARQLIENPE